jgi:hypothetical protein
LSYGQVLGVVNALTLLFQGKWQQAMMQALTLLNVTFGGIPVGVIIQVLFMVFPGLGAIFGKGGGSDKPSTNCQHCGCVVKDPAGADNCRDYKPGCKLCQYCGTELRSGRNPQVFPGQPPIHSHPSYPFGAGAESLVPRTRTGLRTSGCGYVDGSTSEVNNKDCAGQEAKLGPFNANNSSQFSLYCRDEYAYYGNFSRSGEDGTSRDNKYNSEIEAKSANTPSEYMILAGGHKKNQFYKDVGESWRGICSLNQDAKSKKACDAAFAAWAIVKDHPESSNLVRICGFTKTQNKDDSLDQADLNRCVEVKKQLNSSYNGIPSAYRDAVFNSLNLIDDNTGPMGIREIVV